MTNKVDREDLVRLHHPDYMYEIGDDCDGLGCMEIRYIEYVDKKPVIKIRLSFSTEDAKAIGEALIDIANKKQANKKPSYV